MSTKQRVNAAYNKWRGEAYRDYGHHHGRQELYKRLARTFRMPIRHVKELLGQERRAAPSLREYAPELPEGWLWLDDPYDESA